MDYFKAYDLPLRIFHWSFAVLFVSSFSIAKLIDDDSALYAYHMLSGILMVSLVILRIIWGFVGQKTSKFSSFKLRPSELIHYMKSVVSTRSQRYLGHNPASSYVAILMFLSTLGIALTGLMMTLRINKHFFEEVHELFANGFLLLVLFHIAGVLLHQVKHNDGMIFSMLSGKKAKIEDEDEIKSNHPVVAMVFAFAIFFIASSLLRNFETKTGKLNVFGTHLQLGENEHKDKLHDDHDDDDD